VEQQGQQILADPSTTAVPSTARIGFIIFGATIWIRRNIGSDIRLAKSHIEQSNDGGHP
jgi:hypothetical protein